jgi:tRNA (uracil-5-)-methyltransferase
MHMKVTHLDGHDFSTVLVDPPRAGLDETTRRLVSRFDRIVYISCNPETLSRDLQTLTQTHTVVSGAIFDQFPHTEHIESGVLLARKKT